MDITITWISGLDRKSTRLNSSHRTISYAVFCLKKNHTIPPEPRICLLLHCAAHCDCHDAHVCVYRSSAGRQTMASPRRRAEDFNFFFLKNAPPPSTAPLPPPDALPI